jgi:hypothetical protein
LYLDDCLATTIMPQPAEITEFIFGQPLKGEGRESEIQNQNGRVPALQPHAGGRAPASYAPLTPVYHAKLEQTLIARGLFTLAKSLK